MGMVFEHGSLYKMAKNVYKALSIQEDIKVILCILSSFS